MQVEPLGCSYFRSPMWDCASREWACCYGNVFEYFGADPVTMMYFDFKEGAACMLCCAGALTVNPLRRRSAAPVC